MEEKKRLWVQTKMDPCFDKMTSHYVANMAEIWCKPECPPASPSAAAPLALADVQRKQVFSSALMARA